jgi:hypothetical protein
MPENKKEELEVLVVEIEKTIYTTSIHERSSLERILKGLGIPSIKSFATGLFFLEDGNMLQEGTPNPMKDKLDRFAMFQADGKTINEDGKLLLKIMLLVFKTMSKLYIKKGTQEKFKNFIAQRKRITAAENYLNPNLVEVYNTFYDKVLEIHSAMENIDKRLDKTNEKSINNLEF